MKKLRFLLGNNTLSLLAGSETWTYTLAVQLKRMGHDVSCFSPELGIISIELEKEGISSYKSLSLDGVSKFSYILEPSIDHTYDVIIANHHHIVRYLRSRYPKTPIISTIHGIIHSLDDGTDAPEHPALDCGVNQFVAVSEEVQEKLKKEYNIESTIIRNFFDLKKLSVKRPVSDTPKQFLINTNYNGKDDKEISVIREVAKHYGAKLAAIGVNFSHALDVNPAIESSDVVFGIGRSVLEGVAAGRLGIVHGRWGTAGPIARDTVDEIRKRNFSGRKFPLATKEQLIEMIDTYYNPQTIEWGKDYMTRNHNVVLGAEMFISIARELTGQTFNKPQVRPESHANGNPGMKKLQLAK